MTEICCGVAVGEGEGSKAHVEPGSRISRRSRLDMLQLKYLATEVMLPAAPLCRRKRHKSSNPGVESASPTPLCEKSVDNGKLRTKGHDEDKLVLQRGEVLGACSNSLPFDYSPKFGVTSVCGRRRDMEDAVSVRPSFCEQQSGLGKGFHFYGVYDGHGCSHVANMCKDRMHEIVKEELEVAVEASLDWKDVMERSFDRVDGEVSNSSDTAQRSSCKCELQTPHCEAVGSTAVVAVVTPDKIVVSNCGDSRAVLCRNGVAVPLSSDHKPDRPDELLRVEAAGGRVIYWDGPRVLGVLAMSRAIGDSYLKPYVISEPEVTITDRTAEDECLILASDGFWDVVSNDTACSVARICLRAQKRSSAPESPGEDVGFGSRTDSSDKACADASVLLTKLALARHSTDNVSVVVVHLKRDPSQKQQQQQ